METWSDTELVKTNAVAAQLPTNGSIRGSGPVGTGSPHPRKDNESRDNPLIRRVRINVLQFVAFSCYKTFPITKALRMYGV
jgi:hypothetical protein